MSRLIIDFIGPVNSSFGYKYILTCTDATTKYAWAFKCKTADAKTVAGNLIKIILKYGKMRILQSDRGTHFNNEIIKNLTSTLGINQILSSAYSPQTQGLTEKFNGTLTNMLSHYVHEKPDEWSKYLDKIVYCYNSTKQTSTGFTPNKLMFAFEPNNPMDIIQILENPNYDIRQHIKQIQEIRQTLPEIIKRAQDKQKWYYDKKRTDFEFQQGDEVLIKREFHGKTPSKFDMQYTGPYPIIKKINKLTYLVEILKYGRLQSESIHISRMKMYHRRSI